MLLCEDLEGRNELLVFLFQLLRCPIIFCFLIFQFLNGLRCLLLKTHLLGQVVNKIWILFGALHLMKLLLGFPLELVMVLLMFF